LEQVGELQIVSEEEAGNQQVLPILELYSTKYDNVSKTFKQKVRSVVQGNKEIGLESETYAPVAATHVIKAVFCILGIFGFSKRQMDFKTAFLNGRRNKPFFLELPLGHKHRKEGKIWKCLCSVYGLRDAPRRWYLTLCRVLLKLGLKPCPIEPCLFINADTKLTIVLYVDDIMYFAPEEKYLKTKSGRIVNPHHPVNIAHGPNESTLSRPKKKKAKKAVYSRADRRNFSSA